MTLLEALKNGEYININNFYLIEKELKSKPSTYIHQYNVSPTWLLHEYRVTEYNGSTIIYKLKPFAQANIAQTRILNKPNSLPIWVVSSYKIEKNDLVVIRTQGDLQLAIVTSVDNLDAYKVNENNKIEVVLRRDYYPHLYK